jgi:acyl carrier protein
MTKVQFRFRCVEPAICGTLFLRMNGETFQQLREIAADILGVTPDTIGADSSPETVEGWDSVQQLNLIVATERRFDVLFDPEEIDEMKNIGAMAAIVDRKRAGLSA